MLDYLFTKTPFAFLVQNIWRDEAFSYLLALEPIHKIISFTAGDFSPPLYYLFLHFWLMIFGTSEVALRGLSLFFYVFTLYMAYEILVYVFKYSHKKTFIFLLLFLLNPFLHYYATEARMYMMVTFFVALSYFALWKDYRKTYMIAITMALYTHYFAVFILVAQWLPRIFPHLKKIFSHRNLKSWWQYVWREYKLAIIPVLCFVPWLIFISIHHSFNDGTFWIIEPPKKDFFYIPFLLFTGYERVFGEYYHEKAGYTAFHTKIALLLWTIVLLPALYIATKYVVDRIHKSSRFHFLKTLHLFKKGHETEISSHVYLDIILWAFFAPMLIFFMAYITQPLFHPRYYIFASVGFTLLMVIAFDYLWKHAALIGKIISVALFIALLQWTWSFMKLNLKYRSKRNIAPFVQEVASLVGPQDLIYTTSELDYHLIQYYLKDKKDKLRIYNKTYEEIPAYVGKVLIPEDSLVYTLPKYPKKAFVMFYSWYEIQARL